jgi:hypothetical protein
MSLEHRPGPRLRSETSGRKELEEVENRFRISQTLTLTQKAGRTGEGETYLGFRRLTASVRADLESRAAWEPPAVRTAVERVRRRAGQGAEARPLGGTALTRKGNASADEMARAGAGLLRLAVVEPIAGGVSRFCGHSEKRGRRKRNRFRVSGAGGRVRLCSSENAGRPSDPIQRSRTTGQAEWACGRFWPMRARALGFAGRLLSLGRMVRAGPPVNS